MKRVERGTPSSATLCVVTSTLYAVNAPAIAVSHGRRDWVDATERRAASKVDSLETELNGYKTNLIKESIRMGHNDLGDFYYARGDLQVRGTALRPACVPSIGLHFHHLLTGAARTRPMCQTPHTLRWFSRLCRSDACSATSVPQAISPPANPDSPPCNFLAF